MRQYTNFKNKTNFGSYIITNGEIPEGVEELNIVFDSYTGLDIPNMDVIDEVKYRIMYIWDVIAVVDK